MRTARGNRPRLDPRRKHPSVILLLKGILSFGENVENFVRQFPKKDGEMKKHGSWFRAALEQLQVTNNRNQSSMKSSSRLNLPRWLITAGLAAMLMLSAQTSMAQHGSATWLASPPNNIWG